MKQKSIPGWTEGIKSLKNDALFWGILWRDTGRSTDTVVHDVYKLCRRKYHYAIRAHKKKDKQLRMAKLAENVANNDSRNLWKELRAIRGQGKVCPPHIDGKVTPEEINDLFKNKYQTLYNSAGSNLEKIHAYIDSHIDNSDTDLQVSIELIDQAMKMLKRDKSDGDKGPWSTLVIETPVSWRSVLAKLIQCMIVHGHYASELLVSTIVSLPKDLQKSDVCSSDNYRGIALMSCLNKIADWILLLKYPKSFETSNMQYAFKKGHSTSMCTLALKEVVNYYCNRKGKVYCAMLDASKAFDGVKFDKLFNILKQRGIPALILRLLLHQYTSQKVRTLWKGETSTFFNTVNGVRQGGVISPILFTLYIDVLLQRLKASGFGCMVGQAYFGTVCYADDITLLSPTMCGLQSMLRICENYGSEFNIKYNPKKTVCVCFSKTHVAEMTGHIKLYGEQLPWSTSAKHLGNIVNGNLSDLSDIQSKRRDFINRVNSLIANFKSVSRSICSHVFNSQCCHLYGTEIWNLQDKSVEPFYVTWRKAVRKLWWLPNMTRSDILPHLVNSESIQVQLCRRFLGLMRMV
jgi:hypothetical protein